MEAHPTSRQEVRRRIARERLARTLHTQRASSAKGLENFETSSSFGRTSTIYVNVYPSGPFSIVHGSRAPSVLEQETFFIAEHNQGGTCVWQFYQHVFKSDQ